MHRNGPFSTMWYRGLAGSTQHAVLWLITLFFTVILAHKLTTSTALGYPGVVVMLTESTYAAIEGVAYGVA